MYPFPMLEGMRERWLILGHQLLISNILRLTAKGLPAGSPKATERRCKSVLLFETIIQRAIIGASIIRNNKKGVYNLSIPFNRAVECEKAYRELSIIFPDVVGVDELRLMGRLRRICADLAKGVCSAENMDFMHNFCHEAMGRLDQKHFRLMGY
jgi:hypothetical protein